MSMRAALRRHVPLAAFAAAFVLLAAAQVWLSHLRYNLSISIHEQQQQHEVLRQDIQKLQIELASLTRPERLRRIANDLGMRPPAPGKVVHP